MVRKGLNIKGGESMKLKWTDEELRYFSKPIKKAERTGDWFWYAVMATCLGAIGWMLVKLYQLYQIRLWVESI